MNRQSKYSRLLLYGIILIGAVPLLVPFIWLISSSLKSYNRVYHYPPEWLPRTEKFYLSAETDNPLLVNIIDKNEDTRTGVYRVRITGTAAGKNVSLPRLLIRIDSSTIYHAKINNQFHAAELLDSVSNREKIKVKLKNKNPQIEIPTADVESRIITRQAIQLYRQNIIVEVVEENEDRSLIRIAEASKPFEISLSRVKLSSENSGSILLLQNPMPVQVIHKNENAKIASVKLIPSPQLFEVENHRIFETRSANFFIKREGNQIPIKWVKHGKPGEMSLVKRLDQPLIVELSPAEIRREIRTTYTTKMFGQLVELKPIGKVLENQLTAVKILQPLSLETSMVKVERKFAPQWKNYVDVLRKEPFHYYVLNTLFIALCSILGQILSCSLVGYSFSRLRFPGRDFLFIVLLSTMMLPQQIILIPQFIIYVKLGWLDSFKPLIVPTFLAQSAFFVFLFRQYFMTISYDLEDAARIDGCGPLYAYWHIMLPLAKPVIVTVAVFTFMWTWNDFLYPLLYLNSDEHQTLALALQNFKTAFGLRDPHLLMAASTMMILPSIILFFLAQKAFIRGVVVTGVKG